MKSLEYIAKLPTFAPVNAEIAQLVEHNLAKVRVASSSLVFRLRVQEKGSVNQRFTEPFPFYALDWTYPYYIQFMRFRGSQLNHELNPNAV